jgi:hypothetical protein
MGWKIVSLDFEKPCAMVERKFLYDTQRKYGKEENFIKKHQNSFYQ